MTAAQQVSNPRFVTAPTFTRLAIRTLSNLAPPLAVRFAASLFRYPRLIARPAARQRSATRFEVRAGRHTVRGHVRGEGPVVILLHGWAGTEEQFDAIGDALLARGFRIVTFNPIGHGASTGRLSSLVEFRDSLRAVVEHFGEPHAIAGHSLGGAASAFAVSEGLHTNRLVLIAPAAHPQRYLNLFLDWLDFPHAMRERVVQHFEKTLRFAWKGLDVEAYGPRIEVPTLIVHDRGDREIPWQEGSDAARVIRDAELVSVESLGHHRLLRDSTVVARIAGFIAIE